MKVKKKKEKKRKSTVRKANRVVGNINGNDQQKVLNKKRKL